MDNVIPGTWVLTVCDHGNRLYQVSTSDDNRLVVVPADPSCKGTP